MSDTDKPAPPPENTGTGDNATTPPAPPAEQVKADVRPVATGLPTFDARALGRHLHRGPPGITHR